MKLADPKLAQASPPHPIRADALRPIVEEWKANGAPLRMAMVFPVSTHNYELRYWLAAGGIHPGLYTNGDSTGTSGADVLISVTPPPQMPPTLAQGTIQGYSVGEPWNQQAVFKGVGVPVITDYEIWRNNPEKVFGVTADWAAKNPETHIAVVKALIRAGKWLDQSLENRQQAVLVLARPEYVGADAEVIANSMTGTFEYEKGDRRELADFNVFFRDHATFPYYSDAVWYLTQMRRWGQIDEPKSDAWYDETARSVYKPEVWREAAKRLLADGKLAATELPETDGYAPPDTGFIDGIAYDGRKPSAYLRSLAIGLKD
jgi:nitrate/nitrite transport system substrate-binding protein